MCTHQEERSTGTRYLLSTIVNNNNEIKRTLCFFSMPPPATRREQQLNHSQQTGTTTLALVRAAMTEGSFAPSTPHRRGRGLRSRLASWTGGSPSSPKTPIAAIIRSSSSRSPVKKKKSYIQRDPEEKVQRTKRKSKVNNSLNLFSSKKGDEGDTSVPQEGEHPQQGQEQHPHPHPQRVPREEEQTPKPPERRKSKTRRSLTRSNSSSRRRRRHSSSNNNFSEQRELASDDNENDNDSNNEEDGNNYEMPVSVRKLRPPSCGKMMVDDYDNETCDPTERTSTSSLSQYTQQLGSEKSLLSTFSANCDLVSNGKVPSPDSTKDHREHPPRTRSESSVPSPTETTTVVSTSRRRRRSSSRRRSSGKAEKTRTTTTTTITKTSTETTQLDGGIPPSTPSSRRRRSVRRLQPQEQTPIEPDALEGSISNLADLNRSTSSITATTTESPLSSRPHNTPRSKSFSRRSLTSSSSLQQSGSFNRPSSTNLQESLTLNSLTSPTPTTPTVCGMTSSSETPNRTSTSNMHRSSVRSFANSQESLTLASLTVPSPKTPLKPTSSFSRRSLRSLTATPSNISNNNSTPLMERSSSVLSRRSLSSSLGSFRTTSSSNTLQHPMSITPKRRHVPNVTRKRAERNRALQELVEDQALTELLERVMSKYPRHQCRTLDEHQQEAKKELSRQKDELCSTQHSLKQQQQQVQKPNEEQPNDGEEEEEKRQAKEKKDKATLEEQLEFTCRFSENNRTDSQVTTVTSNRSVDDSADLLLLSAENFENLQSILEEKLAAQFAEEASTLAESHLILNDISEAKSDPKHKVKGTKKSSSSSTTTNNKISPKNANASDDDEDLSVSLVGPPAESPVVGQHFRKSLLRDKAHGDENVHSMSALSPSFGRHVRKTLPMEKNEDLPPSKFHTTSKLKRNSDNSKKNAFCYPSAPPPPLPPQEQESTSDSLLLFWEEGTISPPMPPLQRQQEDKALDDVYREAATGESQPALLPPPLPPPKQEERDLDDFLRQGVEEQAAAAKERQVAASSAPTQKKDTKPSRNSSLRNVEDEHIVESSSKRIGRYTGTVCTKSGKPHGVGKMIYQANSSKSSSWYYKGEWIQGEWSGHGHHLKANGDEYQGEFLLHVKHGRGTYRYHDCKRTFEGRYINGQRVEGRMTYADGSVYDGQWYRGKRHGRGSYTFCDGSIYEGEFELDQIHGSGQLTWPAPGGKFVGDWCRGQRHGRGREVGDNGKLLREGIWNEGVPVELA